MVPKLTYYSNTWNLQSSSNPAALSGFGLSEAHLFKEFPSHIFEPLKNTYSDNLEFKCVLVIGTPLKYCPRAFRAETLLMFVGVQLTFEAYFLKAEDSVNVTVREADGGAISAPEQKV